MTLSRTSLAFVAVVTAILDFPQSDCRISDDWQLSRLLRTRSSRPRDPHAAEQRDEIAAFQLTKLHAATQPGEFHDSITHWPVSVRGSTQRGLSTWPAAVVAPRRRPSPHPPQYEGQQQHLEPHQDQQVQLQKFPRPIFHSSPPLGGHIHSRVIRSNQSEG
jgi:hypothetical protein